MLSSTGAEVVEVVLIEELIIADDVGDRLAEVDEAAEMVLVTFAAGINRPESTL